LVVDDAEAKRACREFWKEDLGTGEINEREERKEIDWYEGTNSCGSGRRTRLPSGERCRTDVS